jgi:serine protease Do
MNDSPQNSMTKWVRRHGRLVAVSTAAVIVALGLGAFALLPAAHHVTPADHTPVQIAADTPAQKAPPPRMLESGAPYSFADLVERVSPAVVTITAETTAPKSAVLQEDIPEPFRNFFRQFGNGQAIHPRREISAGSGFIISKSGLIVTNNHVIKDSTKITVKLPDGRSFTAKLMGTDPATDIALLKIDSKKPLPTVEFGDDRQLRVGDWVIAVGNPFGLSNTVTAGIVSSIGRGIDGSSYNDFIQIDAPINRGNSGGPTFDLRGQVIGMNSMIFSPSGGSVGIGFAIPASTIHNVVAQLEAHGHVSRGWLGVDIQSVTPEIATSLGLKEPKGAIVASVVPGSPADKAGFQQGDVVLAVDGKTIEDNRDMTRRVAALAAGKDARFTINRAGVTKTLTAKIGLRNEKMLASLEQHEPGAPAAANTGKAMGLGLAALTPEIRRAHNLSDDVSGILITSVDPDSDAAEKGLQPGDVVQRVGTHNVRTVEDFQKSVEEATKGGRKSVLLLVATQGGSRFVAVDIAKT